MSNVMLHVHPSCPDQGAVPFFVVEISVAFPQFFHAFLCLEDREERGAVQMLNDAGIRAFHGPLTRAVVESVDPVIVVLHDVGGDAAEGKPPWGWLRRWPTISWHHSAVRPTVQTDLHVFGSEAVRGRYENLVKSGFIPRWATIPVDVHDTVGPWFHRKVDRGNVSAVRDGLSPAVIGMLMNSALVPAAEPPKVEISASVWGDRKPLLPRGVVVGCGSEQEWMLPWWWENYSKHNALPVLFIDMGFGEKAMTGRAREWCASKGTLGELHVPMEGWFQKPFALSQTVFEESVWTDVDVEIRGSLEPIFDQCKNGLAAAGDPYYRFSKVPVSVNSGVLAFKFGNKTISDWCSMILKEGKNYRDDQVILNVLAHRNPGSVGNLPREFNWLRLDGDANPDAVCVHWTGGRGKEIVRAKMEGKYLREHFIADFANTLGWKSGLEIGTWRGRTFLHLLKTCPKLAMTTIDLWEPQPENHGPEKYTREEGERWDHVKNEEYVRAEAAMYGTRAVILKGNSREIVPSLTGQFDFAFIDGDHGSEAVETDIRNAMQKLNFNGILFGHDIDWPSVKGVVTRMFPRFLVGPDNVWYVRVRDVLGPHGCPVGAIGIDGPAGA